MVFRLLYICIKKVCSLLRLLLLATVDIAVSTVMTKHLTDSILISVEDSNSRVLFLHCFLEYKEIIKCCFDFFILAELIWLFACFVLALPIQTWLLEQHFHNLFVSIQACVMQRCISIGILEINICTCSYEQLGNIFISGDSRDNQGCLLDGTFRVNRRFVVQQLRSELSVSIKTSIM